MTYWDGRFDGVEFTREIIRLAERHGADAVTRARAQIPRARESDGFYHVAVTDTGTKEKYTIKARAVVAALGAWEKGVHRTRGTHLVVARNTAHAVIRPASNGSVLFVLPYQNGATLIGTTDVVSTGDPDKADPHAGRDHLSYR